MKLIDTDELAQIVKEFNEGNELKFKELYDLTWRHAYFGIVRRIGDSESVKDILQDVYIQVYKKTHKLEDEKSFLAWLDRVIISKHVDFLRRNERHKTSDEYETKVRELLEDDKNYLPEEKVLFDEEHQELRELIKGLPEAQRISIEMYYFQDMSTFQIAKAMGVSENVVRKRLFDARSNIKKRADKLSKQYRDKYNLYSLAQTPILLTILVDALVENSEFIGALLNETLRDGIIELSKKPLEEISKGSAKNLFNAFTQTTKSIANIAFTKTVAITVLCATIGATGVTYLISDNKKSEPLATTQSQNVEIPKDNNIIISPKIEAKLIETSPQPQKEINIDTEKIIAVINENSENVNKNITTSEQKKENISKSELPKSKEEIETTQPQQTENLNKETNKNEVILEPSPSSPSLKVQNTSIPKLVKKVTKNYVAGIPVSQSDFINDISFLLGNEFNLSMVAHTNFENVVDFYKVGTYKTYIKTKTDLDNQNNDQNNNDLNLEVIVTVNILDQSPPEITAQDVVVKTTLNAQLSKEEIILKSELKVNDNIDKNINIDLLGLENVNYTQHGEYPIFASATDESGNQSSRVAIIISVGSVDY